jgi:hypothetical protein
LTRLIFASLALTLLFCVPGRAQCCREDLDPASLRQAQVYLDSLWAIYEFLDTDEDNARLRMHAFLRAWADADKQRMAASADDPVENLCDAVFNATFRPRFRPQSYSHNPGRSPERTNQGDYLILPDSVSFVVLGNTQAWDTLSNGKFSAFVEHLMIRNGLTYRKYRPRLQTTRTVLYGDQIHWCAFYSFLHGDRTPSTNTTARSDRRPQVPGHSSWIRSFIQVCFHTLVTQPTIYRIEFNSTMNEALVSDADDCGYKGATDLYTKIETVWTKKHVVSTWAE